jgi:hypothetical protein
MIKHLPLGLQTAYADLLEKLQDADFDQQTSGFPEGSFVRKIVKERPYWYAQVKDLQTGIFQQKYIGPETPDLLARIERYNRIKESTRMRRDLVRSFTRSGAAFSPGIVVGNVLRALAEAGIFRLRAVLVGTVAYQTYGPMLGVRLGTTAAATEDIDIAQFRSISIAVEDMAPPVLDVLRDVDPSFQPMAKPSYERYPISYISNPVSSSGGRRERLKVEFLTPMRGPDESGVGALPALGTAAQPLRFLDFLIYQEQKAVVLDGAGILVNVPDPTRYALHKLIVSQRRRGLDKVQKDLRQAGILLDVLTEIRPADVADFWQDLASDGRGKWQQLARNGLQGLPYNVREKVLYAIGEGSAPGMSPEGDSMPFLSAEEDDDGPSFP